MLSLTQLRLRPMRYPKLCCLAASCGLLPTAFAQSYSDGPIADFAVDPSGIVSIHAAPSDEILEILFSSDLQAWESARYLFPTADERGSHAQLAMPGMAVAGCAPYFVSVEPAAPIASDTQLLAQWKLWQERRPDSYRLALQTRSEPLGPPRQVLIDVSGETIERALDAESGEPLPASNLSELPTAEILFSLARHAARGSASDIQFDPIFAAPRYVSVGSSSTAFAEIAAQLRGLPLEFVEEQPTEADEDPFTVDFARIIDGDQLVIDATFPSCDTDGNSLIAVEGSIVDINPLQLDLYLRHDDSGIDCQAVTQGRMIFDLSPLSQRLRELYGNPADIQLQLNAVVDGESRFAATLLFQPQGVPTQVVDEQSSDVEERGFAVDSARIEGLDTLVVQATFSTCDTQNNSLIALPVFSDTEPPQLDLYLRHHGVDAPTCQTITQDTLYFDLSPLRAAIRAASGELTDITLHLNTVIAGDAERVATLAYQASGAPLQIVEELPDLHYSSIYGLLPTLANDDRLVIDVIFPSSNTGAFLAAIPSEIQEGDTLRIPLHLRQEHALGLTVLTPKTLVFSLKSLREMLIDRHGEPRPIVLDITTIDGNEVEIGGSVPYDPTPLED